MDEINQLASSREQLLQLLILQPTSFCNLDCRYCYLPHRDKKRTMDLADLQTIARSFFSSQLAAANVMVVWHSGEPLTMPVDYYKNACEILSKEAKTNNIDLRFSLQTNGTLINQSWCDFFNDFNIEVGISADGPRFLHDEARVYRNGQGSFDKVDHAIDLLNGNDIPLLVICVLTRNSLMYADEIFDWCASKNIKFLGFNTEEVEGVNKVSSLQIDEIENKVRHFYRAFLNRVLTSDFEITVREFKSMASNIMHFKSEGTVFGNQQSDPWRIVTVAADGRFSTFSPELIDAKDWSANEFTLGNFLESGSEVDVAKINEISDAVALGVKRCAANCDYFGVCGGGAPSNKLSENNDLASTETLHCVLSKKIVADVVLEGIEQGLV